MPNGRDKNDAEWERMRNFFKKIYEPLTDFASAHNLVIDKYYHEFSSWNFRFRHPMGGIASIEVSYVDDDTCSISAYWHIDNYDEDTSTKQNSGKRELKLKEVNLFEELTKYLLEVINWKMENAEVQSGNNSWEETWTKDEFERMQTQYPTVSIPSAKYPPGSQQRIDSDRIWQRTVSKQQQNPLHWILFLIQLPFVIVGNMLAWLISPIFVVYLLLKKWLFKEKTH